MMRRAATVLVWCVLGVCVAGVSPAVAAAKATGRHGEPTIRLKKIGVSSTPVYTDGARFAVYEPTLGVTRIMDTIKGTTVNRPDPEGCAGGLITMGGGEILYACSDPECPEAQDACVFSFVQTVGQPEKPDYENARLVIQDIASGVQHAVVGESHIAPVSNPDFGGPDAFEAVGGQWLVGKVNEYHGGGLFFLNWHTGRVLNEPENAARDSVNLNSTALLAPLCKPLIRGVAPVPLIGFYSHYFLSQYAFPFMVEERFKHGDEAGEPHRVYLRRCGSRQAELISEFNGVSGLQVGSGILTYSRRVWRLNTSRRHWLGQAYRLIGAPQGYGVQHTSTEIIATAARLGSAEPKFQEGAPSKNSPKSYNVLIARLPWVRKH